MFIFLAHELLLGVAETLSEFEVSLSVKSGSSAILTSEAVRETA